MVAYTCTQYSQEYMYGMVYLHGHYILDTYTSTAQHSTLPTRCITSWCGVDARRTATSTQHGGTTYRMCSVPLVLRILCYYVLLVVYHQH
jgi:hypothetical protein